MYSGFVAPLNGPQKTTRIKAASPYTTAFQHRKIGSFVLGPIPAGNHCAPAGGIHASAKGRMYVPRKSEALPAPPPASQRHYRRVHAAAPYIRIPPKNYKGYDIPSHARDAIALFYSVTRLKKLTDIPQTAPNRAPVSLCPTRTGARPSASRKAHATAKAA